MQHMQRMQGNISAGTALCGIVLHPAGHTRSPAMHNAAYRALGLDARYHVFDVLPEALPDAIAGVRALGLRQIAISLPHKQSVIPLLDRLDETAEAIGAVNTVTRDPKSGALRGSNTDWKGALRALERVASPAGQRAVVLGAGGAARAVTFALLKAGSEVTILNRTESRARELREALGASRAGALAELAAIEYEILVNATQVGLRSDRSPVPAAALRAGSLVMDAVYEPEQTRLLRDARERGARTVEGKWMLVYQAAEQLELCSGCKAPLEVMADAFDAAGADAERGPLGNGED